MKETKYFDDEEAARLADRQVLLYNARLKAIREGKSTSQGYAFRIIAIAREIGSLGDELAGALAEETGWQIFDRQIIDYIAKNNHVRESIVKELDEKAQNLMQDAVERLLWMAVGESFFGEKEYHLALMKTLAALSGHGQIIFVGHGSTYGFTDPWCLRLRITASLETRIKRLREGWNASEEKVRKSITESDHEIREFVRLHFNKDRDYLPAYDMIFNTDHLSLSNVVNAVMSVMKGNRK